MKVILGIIGVIMSIYAIEITAGVISDRLTAGAQCPASGTTVKNLAATPADVTVGSDAGVVTALSGSPTKAKIGTTCSNAPAAATDANSFVPSFAPKPFAAYGVFGQFAGIVALGGLAMAAGIIWVLYQQFFRGRMGGAVA